MAINWKIFYDDGATYSSDPYLAPPRGVMVVVHKDRDHGRYMRFNHDYYWYEQTRDCWEGGDLFGLYDYLLRPGPRKVIFGRIVENETFQEIYKIATNDPDFEPKTAFSFGEHKP